MKVILLHNATAGQSDQPSADNILRAIRETGHSVVYQSSRDQGAKWTMLEPADLVVAAGGDGTVRKAALGVAGRHTPLAILPLGTANNLAKALGITGDFRQIIRGLDTASSRRLNLGIASGPWGKVPFIESAGAGLLARMISCMRHADGGPSAPPLERAREQLRKLLPQYRSRKWFVRVDDREFWANLLLVEAMNIPLIGPNLRLSPHNDPGDGLLDVVLLNESRRAAFADFLHAPSGTDPDLPIEIIRGRTLHLRLSGREPAHADDHTWPDEEQQANRNDGEADTPSVLEMHLAAEIEVLVPATEAA